MIKKEAWIISVDMGYGHQRAAYPLKEFAYERILTANSDKIISDKEEHMWHRFRLFYETISKIKEFPIIGKIFFGFYDQFQKISPLFPFRDLSKPNIGTLYFRRLIKKKGLCKSLIEYIRKKNIPIIATHFVPALAAQYFGLKNVYCIVTDSDINRVWVIDKPEKNKIKYLVPCEHTKRRLKEYGIKDKDIIKTGFPLPRQNIGKKDMALLKKDLRQRLINLDPKKNFINRYKETIRKQLSKNLNIKRKPITITYVVGGAGAEKEIGIKIIRSLKEEISKNKVIINLIAGTHLNIKSYFEEQVKKCGIRKNINIIYALDKRTYFNEFNKILRKTDILWSKPSEISFYTALGMPIIIAPPIGAHEHFNKQWLEHIGSGFVQENPDYVNDWLFYWLEKGRLAEAAWQGFTEAPVLGTYNIEKIVFKI